MISKSLPTPLTYEKLHSRRIELRTEIEEQEQRIMQAAAYHLSPYHIAYRMGKGVISGIVSSVSINALLRNIRRAMRTTMRYIEKLMT